MKVFKLEGREPVEVSDLSQTEFNDRDQTKRIVARDVLPGGVSVSTVFLCIDHRFGEGPPLLFETMIFGGPHDSYQERYSTYDEAETGHARALELARSGS